MVFIVTFTAVGGLQKWGDISRNIAFWFVKLYMLIIILDII